MTILRYVLVLTLICMLSAGLLSLVERQTSGPIAQSIKREKVKAIREVMASRFPDATVPGNLETSAIRDTINPAQPEKSKTVTFYPVKNGSGRLVGHAAEIESFQGYSGRIAFMFGFSLNGEVTGTYVLEHSETPGLGSKMTDPSFKKQFKGLSRNGRDIKIEKYGGSIESISGASISSHAFTAALNQALKIYQTKIRG